MTLSGSSQAPFSRSWGAPRTMVDMTEPASTSRDAAAERLRARAQRLRTIRRRVAATALATFAIAFGVIGLTGSMGTTSGTTLAATHASTSSSATTSSDDPSATTSSDDSSGTTSGDDSSSSSSDDSSSGSAGAAMTTQHS